MNARKSNNHNMARSILCGVLFAALSFTAAAEPTSSVDARPPLAATLLPCVKVTASISNPSDDARWSVSPERALRVTLMPTVTVTADVAATAVTPLPTENVIAERELLRWASSPGLTLEPSVDSPMLGVSD